MSKIFQHISNRRTTSAGYHLLAKAGPAMLALVLICAMLGANFTSAAAAGNQYYVDKTNIACSDTGPGSAAVPFCTLFKAWNTATVPGDTVNVVHGTYAETVYPASGTSDNLITFHAVNSDVTVTGDTAFGAGFAVTSRSYVVIDGFNIYHTKGRGIYSEDSNHIIITNNHVSYAGADTGPTTHAEGIFLSGTTYSTVSENISEHNSCIGIRLIGNSNFNTVSDNLAYSNASDIAYPNVAVSDAAGIDVTDSNNNTIVHNIVHGNEDTGINMYVGSLNAGASNNFIVGNLSYSNGDHGIDNNGSPNNTIVGNTVQGNHTSGINLEAGSGGATLANNITVDNGRAPTGGRKAYNIYVDSNSTAGTTMDYDLVFVSPGVTTQIKWGSTGYSSMAAFQGGVPGQEVNGLQGNPLLASPASYNPAAMPSEATGDYHILAGSPAIDSANSDASHETDHDLDGYARIDDAATTDTGAGTRTYDDRGAYEYQPGTSAPTVTTQAVTAITSATATGHGTVTALGIPDPTQHGVVWDTAANPTTALTTKTTDGPVSATGAFTSNITGLLPSTLYHVRAYATNSGGTAYGADVTFTTLSNLPTVTTEAVTAITTTTATGNGTVTALGIPNPTQHGVVWDTAVNPTIALTTKTTDGLVSAIGPFTSSITGLTAGTLYHVRAYATNSAGTVYGADVTFTSYLLPTVTTEAVTNIGATTATGNGNVTALGVPNPTQHGVVWSTVANPTITDGHTTDGVVSAAGAFTSNMTGLAENTLYHVRAYATNGAGTVYGPEVTFTTLVNAGGTTPPTDPGSGSNITGLGTVAWANPGNVASQDGNYATVTLNNQVSNYLEGTNYGFAIPSDATIQGIAVTIGRFESGTGSGTDVRDNVVRLMKGGTLTGDNKAATSQDWPISLTARTYGSSSDLWGATWTPTDINASNFGAALAVNSNNARTASVDYMRVAVTYSIFRAATTTTVSCGSGTPAVTYGSGITCVATVTRVIGAASPSGHVSWTTGGSGNFATSPCVLSGSGASTTCSVTYTPASVGAGSHSITATYAGDSVFATSSNSQAVTVHAASVAPVFTVDNKVYDGTTDATILTRSLTGVINADVVTLNGGTATFDTKTVGTGKTVTGSGFTLGGPQAGNYTLSPTSATTTANITPRELTASATGVDKMYDGTTAATVQISTNKLSGDTVTGSYTTATFADKNVGGSISVAVSGISISGTDADNYQLLSTTATATANINPADLKIRANNITKHPGATYTFAGTEFTIDPTTAVYEGDAVASVTLSSEGAAASAVNGDYPILASAAVGTGLSNYTISYIDGTLTVTDAGSNTAPVITEGASKSVTMSVNGTPTVFSLTLHSTDAESDPITWSITTPPAVLGAVASVSTPSTGNSMAIHYTPKKNYLGTDQFVVTADDGFGGTDTITVNVTVSPRSLSFKSVSTYDGWVLESGEFTNQGATLNPTATTFSLGDDKTKKQYRGILSFNTKLPAGAKITGITLQIKTSSTLAVANSMFKGFGNILVDIKKGNFGLVGLEITDFQAAPTKLSAMAIKNTPVGGWYSATIGSGADLLVNKTGVTQFRLRFTLDDNNNLIANVLNFYSGNSALLANRPVLTVRYYVPLP